MVTVQSRQPMYSSGCRGTPEIRNPWGHSVQPHLQIVFWGPAEAGDHVLPIHDVDAVDSVCAVCVPTGASAMQILVKAGSACPAFANATYCPCAPRIGDCQALPSTIIRKGCRGPVYIYVYIEEIVVLSSDPPYTLLILKHPKHQLMESTRRPLTEVHWADAAARAPLHFRVNLQECKLTTA